VGVAAPLLCVFLGLFAPRGIQIHGVLRLLLRTLLDLLGLARLFGLRGGTGGGGGRGTGQAATGNARSAGKR
jgi:hypothetical protein